MDVCPKCRTETVISASGRMGVKDGKRVKVYEVQDLRCRNPNCPDYGKKVGERKCLLFDGIPEEQQ